MDVVNFKLYKSLVDHMEDYKVGNSGYTIKIDVSWRVLDVGSGDNPHPRSDVIMDKNVESNEERSGADIVVDDRFVKGDAEAMPFKNKEFDYIIASQIAEHVENPENFCKELMRVGKSGYIETPSKFTEIILGEIFHKWYVYEKNGILIFERIKPNEYLKKISGLFYALYYINEKRVGKRTIYFNNTHLSRISYGFAMIFLRIPWMKARKWTYTCFEWEDCFKFRIIH